MADTDEPANLPGIQKGTTTFTGLHPYRPGPKSGDRFFLDKGDGKILEHIAGNVTYDRHGGFTFTPRPVTREDGPRTLEHRKLVRAMRRSRRRRKMRAWVGRVLGREWG